MNASTTVLRPFDNRLSYRKKKRNSAAAADPVIMAMSTADIAAVHALECRSYAFPWTRALITNCLNHRCECWLIKHAGRVVTYGIMSLYSDTSHLLNLCVDSNFRRLGFACRMVQFLSEIAISHNVKHMLLEVRVSNRRALNLYQKLGFEQVGHRNQYYPCTNGSEDALVLAKRF